MAEAQALAAPVEFGPEQLMLSPELLQVLTTGNAARLVEVLSTEGQTNGQVAIDVPATAAVAAPPGQAARSCLLGVTSNGNTALHLAASRGHAEVTALLCEKAPSLVATRNRGLDTPLHCAAKAGHWRVAACLLSAMRAGGEEATAALRARNCLGATAYRCPNGPPDPSPALARSGPARRGPALYRHDAFPCRAVSDHRAELPAQARH
jgi:hypothetical protein